MDKTETNLEYNYADEYKSINITEKTEKRESLDILYGIQGWRRFFYTFNELHCQNQSKFFKE